MSSNLGFKNDTKLEMKASVVIQSLTSSAKQSLDNHQVDNCYAEPKLPENTQETPRRVKLVDLGKKASNRLYSSKLHQCKSSRC